MNKWMKLLIAAALVGSITLQFDRGGFMLTAAYAQSGAALTIMWSPPTQYEGGTPLDEQDLDFYTLYCNNAEVKQIDSVIGTTSDVVDLTGFITGNYACNLTVTAIPIPPNVGAESGPSNDINFTIGPRVPMAPADLSSQ